jgi:hypothetical protein
MRFSVVHILAAGAIGAMVVLSGAPAFAKTVKECNAEYATQKDALKAAGTKKADFVASCRAEAATTAPATPAAAPATPATAPASVKTAKECSTEYSANKAGIKAAGQKKAEFIAACRAGTETIPPAPAAAAPAAAPAPAPVPAPAAAAPAPTAPKTTAVKPKPVAAPTATEAELKAKCPSDTIVWVNTKTKVYHFAGTHNYGNTKSGAYMCEMDATAAGDRAAENEKHP